MKRTVCLVIVAVLLVCLCSCGSDVSDYAKRHGQISVEIVEDYLAGNISYDEADRKLDSQVDSMERYIAEVKEETGRTPFDDSNVRYCILICSLAITTHYLGGDSKANIEEKLKDLKKAIK